MNETGLVIKYENIYANSRCVNCLPHQDFMQYS